MVEHTPEPDGPVPPPHPWHLYVGDLEDLTAPDRFGDTVAHLAARRRFVLCMLEHPRIVSAGNRSFQRAPVDELLAAAASEWTGEPDAAFTAAYAQWQPSMVRTIRKTLERYFPDQAWPWLLHDLTSAMSTLFVRLALATAADADDEGCSVLNYQIDATPPRIEAGATLTEIRKQLAANEPRGVPQKKMERGTYDRYAVWYYRRRVLGEAWSAIARDYHDDEQHQRAFGRGADECDDRPTVRAGVHEAHRLFEEFPSHKGRNSPPE